MKRKIKKYTLNLKVIKRNILIIFFAIFFIKYCSIMSNYNKKVLANYDKYLLHCESTETHVNPIDYKNFNK